MAPSRIDLTRRVIIVSVGRGLTETGRRFISSEIIEVWLEDPSGWHEPAHKHHLDIFVLFFRFSSPRLLFRFLISEATLESYIRQVATTLTYV